jgi:hypothetical protein
VESAARIGYLRRVADVDEFAQALVGLRRPVPRSGASRWAPDPASAASLPCSDVSAGRAHH